jgi:hypothetical protein
MITTDRLEEMQEEVFLWCYEKGWYDKPVSHGTAMALLHSEVTESLEAWRDWGMEDATELPFSPGKVAKPEGVPSEFADILIRMLDDARRFAVNLVVSDFWVNETAGDDFPDSMNMLHDKISLISQALPIQRDVYYASVLSLLLKLCQVYEIDLEAEYKRKMAYNYTRPYRHGRRGAI